MAVKTLIGKNGFLFLQNDNAKELEVHCNNLLLVQDKTLLRYRQYLSKFVMIVIPNKSFAKSIFLPDNFNAIYRPAFDIYKQKLGHNILDTLAELKCGDCYYKTDTHINLNGGYTVYMSTIKHINKLFKLNLKIKECKITQKCDIKLVDLNLGLGDLTWKSNCGNQKLANILDTLYVSSDINQIYMANFKNITPLYNIKFCDYNLNNVAIDQSTNIDWNIISKYIITTDYLLSANNIKVVIFYDSFLLSTLSLYIELFRNVILIKNTYSIDIINKIKPDYVFEFRCERFLF